MSQADTSNTTSEPTLASLVHGYWCACDASVSQEEGDDFDTHIRDELSKLEGVPVRTAADALAALDCLVAEGADLGRSYDGCQLSSDPTSAAVTSVVDELRKYLSKSTRNEP